MHVGGAGSNLEPGRGLKLCMCVCVCVHNYNSTEQDLERTPHHLFVQYLNSTVTMTKASLS